MKLDLAERLNLGISGCAIATSAALASPLFTLSLTLGAFLEVLNYRALRHATAAFFRGHIQGAGGWTGGWGIRFSLLTLAIAGAVAAGAHPVGLVLGLSAIVPSAIIAAWHTPPPEITAPAIPADDPAWDDWNPWLAREIDRVEQADEE